MWMGVPVVTLEGKAHVSRVGVSLLNRVQLAELIARNADEYVRIAVELAGDVPRLCGILIATPENERRWLVEL
jgi:protein O-GlcNAc transferase